MYCGDESVRKAMVRRWLSGFCYVCEVMEDVCVFDLCYFLCCLLLFVVTDSSMWYADGVITVGRVNFIVLCFFFLFFLHQPL